jgi:outer membrane receptor protein involved in Fe transport
MRFRGGYNLSVRSPNVGELMLAKQEVFAGSTLYGDECSLRSNAPFGAGGAVNTVAGLGAGVDANVTPAPAGQPQPLGSPGNPYPIAAGQTAAGAQSAYNICSALMGSGAAYYYGTASHAAQAAPAPAPFGFENQIGNTKLQAEKAHTWTAGVVLSSPWRGNPWIGNLHGSVDYFNIKINGAIELQAIDEVASNCLSQAASSLAAADALIAAANNPCSLVQRLAGTGAAATTTVQFSNEATIWTTGLDFEVDDGWNFDDIGLHAIPGRLQVNWLMSYLFKYDSEASNTPGFNQIYHWAGTLGPSLNGIDPGSSFKYKMNTTLTYLEGPVSVSLNWRYLPRTHNAAYPLYLNQPGGLGACGTSVDCTDDTPSYNIFDLSMTYTFKKNYVFRFGIDNLFDTEPPAVPTTGVGLQANGTYAPGGTLASDGAGGFGAPISLYDTLGRRFYVGLNAKF